MTARRTYERHLRALAEAHGGELRMGGKHYRLCLPGGLVVPASATPSHLRGGRPRLVEQELRRVIRAGRVNGGRPHL